MTAADALGELDDELRAMGILMCFAELKDPMQEKFRRLGLMPPFGDRTFFATIEEAVNTFQATGSILSPEP